MNQIETIGIAELLPGANQFREKNINETFKGMIQPNHGDQVCAYVKVLDRREIFVESVCALLGRAAGLSIPKPYLVIMSEDSLVGSGNINVPLFGLEDANQPSFRHKFTLPDDGIDMEIYEEIVEQLRAWNGLNNSILFDELIMNDDRNGGNFLYGGEGDFTLIDHGRSLSPSARADNLTNPNFLAKLVAEKEDDIKKMRRLNAINIECLESYSRRKYDSLSAQTRSKNYDVEDLDIEFITSVLSDRINHISKILSQQFGFNQSQAILQL